MSKLEYNAEKHEYWYEGRELPSVNKILDKIGFKGFYKKTGIDYAARGTDIHDAIRAYLCGDIVTDWLDQCAYAKQALDEMGFTEYIPEMFEVRGFEIYPDIAGTCDFQGVIDYKSVGVDFKSGQKNPRHYFQAQLYGWLFGWETGALVYVDLKETEVFTIEKNIAKSAIDWYNCIIRGNQ